MPPLSCTNDSSACCRPNGAVFPSRLKPFFSNKGKALTSIDQAAHKYTLMGEFYAGAKTVMMFALVLFLSKYQNFNAGVWHFSPICETISALAPSAALKGGIA